MTPVALASCGKLFNMQKLRYCLKPTESVFIFTRYPGDDFAEKLYVERVVLSKLL
jgi:hypothetical protein